MSMELVRSSRPLNLVEIPADAERPDEIVCLENRLRRFRLLRDQASSPDSLDAPRRQALASLLAGKSISSAASDARVSPPRVRSWLESGVGFIAARNQAIRDQRDTTRRRLELTAVDAAEVLLNAVMSGDVVPFVGRPRHETARVSCAKRDFTPS